MLGCRRQVSCQKMYNDGFSFLFHRLIFCGYIYSKAFVIFFHFHSSFKHFSVLLSHSFIHSLALSRNIELKVRVVIIIILLRLLALPDTHVNASECRGFVHHICFFVSLSHFLVLKKSKSFVLPEENKCKLFSNENLERKRTKSDPKGNHL